MSTITGPALLSMVERMQGRSRAEVARACGYFTTNANGKDRIDYTGFYAALLEARQEAQQPIPDAPRVYAASLSDYNNAIHHGRWIDLSVHTTKEEIQAEIDAMLADSPTTRRTGEPAEEWAFHDCENCDVGEYAPLEKVAQVAEAFDLCIESRRDWDLYRQWCKATNNYHGDGRASFETFAEDYRGAYDSGADFAADILEEDGTLAQVPDVVRPYIDFEGLWEKFRNDGCFEIRHAGQSHIFWS